MNEEAYKDMVFIYIGLCLRKNIHLIAVTGKAGYEYKSIFGFDAQKEMIDFFCID